MPVNDVVTDFGQFTRLRAEARTGDDATLREAAEQFESLFLQTVLKSMREASPGDPIFASTNHDSVYQQLFDQQLARNLSAGPGVGLADLLVRQLGAGPAEAGAALGAAAPGKIRETTTEPPGKEWTSPLEFARRLWPYAKRAAAALGVAPQAVVAQAALETGWGQRIMERAEGGSSHNFFGIKANRDWSGDSVTRSTVEYENGEARREHARFRAYGSIGEGFRDYLEFLTGNPRYAGVAGHGDDVGQFARALQDAGYATDPAYASKISAIADGEIMREAMKSLKFGGLTPID